MVRSFSVLSFFTLSPDSVGFFLQPSHPAWLVAARASTHAADANRGRARRTIEIVMAAQHSGIAPHAHRTLGCGAARPFVTCAASASNVNRAGAAGVAEDADRGAGGLRAGTRERIVEERLFTERT